MLVDRARNRSGLSPVRLGERRLPRCASPRRSHGCLSLLCAASTQASPDIDAARGSESTSGHEWSLDLEHVREATRVGPAAIDAMVTDRTTRPLVLASNAMRAYRHQPAASASVCLQTVRARTRN